MLLFFHEKIKGKEVRLEKVNMYDVRRRLNG